MIEGFCISVFFFPKKAEGWGWGVVCSGEFSPASIPFGTFSALFLIHFLYLLKKKNRSNHMPFQVNFLCRSETKFVLLDIKLPYS